MKEFNAINAAALDIDLLSQAQRTRLHRDKVQSAQKERADAVRELYRALARRFRRQPLVRALVSSAAVIAAAVSLGAILSSEPASAGLGNVSIGHLSSLGPTHVSPSVAGDQRFAVKPIITPGKPVRKAVYCGATDGTEYQHSGCTLW
jgi:hypothetical protein